MSDQAFKFKQFVVHQSKTAMKIGTDGVLLGAWTALNDEKRILDIGCGTGVIALMIAQRSQASITAIDVDLAAFQEAQHNFEISTWKTQLSAQHVSLQEFVVNKPQQFDLIVSNPPYFESNQSLSSRSIARSQHLLNYEALLKSCKNLLHKNGRLSVIVPSNHLSLLTNLALEIGLYPKKVCLIKGKLNGSIKRALVEFSFKKQKLVENDISIELENRHHYSEEYKKLLKDYLIIF